MLTAIYYLFGAVCWGLVVGAVVSGINHQWGVMVGCLIGLPIAFFLGVMLNAKRSLEAFAAAIESASHSIERGRIDLAMPLVLRALQIATRASGTLRPYMTYIAGVTGELAALISALRLQPAVPSSLHFRQIVDSVSEVVGRPEVEQAVRLPAFAGLAPIDRVIELHQTLGNWNTPHLTPHYSGDYTNLARELRS